MDMIYMLRKLVQVVKARKLSPNSDEYHNYIKKYDRFDLMRMYRMSNFDDCKSYGCKDTNHLLYEYPGKS